METLALARLMADLLNKYETRSLFTAIIKSFSAMSMPLSKYQLDQVYFIEKTNSAGVTDRRDMIEDLVESSIGRSLCVG